MRRISFLICMLVWPALGRAALLPVEIFCREAAVTGMRLSPDGRTLTFFELSEDEDSLKFVLQNLDTGKQRVIVVHESNSAWNHLAESYWTNGHRVVFRGDLNWMAVDRDGKRALETIGLGDMIHRFLDEEAGMILMTGYDATSVDTAESMRPDVHRVNSRTGSYTTTVQNPGNVRFWYANPLGEVTAAMEYKKEKSRVMHRADEQTQWAPLPGMNWEDPPTRPLGYSANGRILYMARQSPFGTWGIYPYEISRGEFGEPLLVHPRYDVVPSNRQIEYTSFEQADLIYSPQRQDLLGIRYVTDCSHTLWLDPAMAKLQSELRHALPDRVNTIISMSDDRQRFLVFSSSANDPGGFYLFDQLKQTGGLIIASEPWINPSDMAEVRAIKFKARDGTLLDGYITLPAGRDPKQLPLVMLPRALRERSMLQFDASAQFLANRGYAVLCVNGRGSWGYGDAFWQAAAKASGQLVQTDLADGARWAIQEGVADPRRIAIVGVGDFGGYCALMNLANEPDLYSCGFASYPYTDLSDMPKLKKSYRDDYVFFSDWLGDPSKQTQETLRSISPLYLAEKIKVPVKIMHRKETGSRFYRSSKALVEALEKTGGKVEFSNNFKDPRTRTNWKKKLLEEIEIFLAKHMPIK